MSTGSWVFLTIVLLLVSGGGIGVLSLRHKIRSFSRAAFGTDSFIEGMQRQADILAETPKSVAGMTSLMEPLIMKDFPDFSWPQFASKAENVLTSALLAITAGDINAFSGDASEEMRNQIRNRIEENKAQGITEVYKNIFIHQTEISNYKKESGKCIVKIQSSVEHYHYSLKGDKLIKGDQKRQVQTLYNMELVYVQDASKVEFDNAIGTTCPNCGAPIKNIGNMHCEYCGSAVTPINIKVWSLHKFYEVDYNHI